MTLPRATFASYAPLRLSPSQSSFAALLDKSSSVEVLELTEQIVKQARGVFLWVKLVPSHLLENAARLAVSGYDTEQLHAALINILNSLPDDLEQYYKLVITRIPSSYRWEYASRYDGSRIPDPQQPFRLPDGDEPSTLRNVSGGHGRRGIRHGCQARDGLLSGGTGHVLLAIHIGGFAVEEITHFRNSMRMHGIKDTCPGHSRL